MTFDPKKPLILDTDTSQYRVGAVLSHRNGDISEQPVAFASKTLTPVKVQYSQIEKEALGILYTITKFHIFLYAHKLQLITEHKPLMLFSMVARVLVWVVHRLQCWANDTHFCPTGQHPNANPLSCLPVGMDSEFDREDHVFSTGCRHSSGSGQLAYQVSTRVATASTAHQVLWEVFCCVQQSWSDHPPGQTSDPLHNYFVLCHHLSVFNEALFKLTDDTASRVIIPGTL